MIIVPILAIIYNLAIHLHFFRHVKKMASPNKKGVNQVIY